MRLVLSDSFFTLHAQRAKYRYDMDIIWIIVGAICLLVGLAGCFLPALPGPPLSYVGMILLHLTDKVQFTATQLIVWAILVIIVQVLDYLTPLIGTKYSGGSKWGNRGCIAGTVIGIFLFPPWVGGERFILRTGADRSILCKHERLNKQDVPAASAAGHHDGGYEQWENQLDF